MGEIQIREDKSNKTLIISEKRGSISYEIMRIVAGAVTTAQLQYYRANLEGRIKQVEADLILKYFYNIDVK